MRAKKVTKEGTRGTEVSIPPPPCPPTTKRQRGITPFAPPSFAKDERLGYTFCFLMKMFLPRHPPDLQKWYCLIWEGTALIRNCMFGILRCAAALSFSSVVKNLAAACSRMTIEHAAKTINPKIVEAFLLYVRFSEII